MPKSIQNDGGFKGGRTTVRARAFAILQTPANSALNSRSNTVAVNRAAFEPDKVVTGVVRDLKSGRKPKYTRVSEVKFIGEQNRSTKNKDLKTSGCLLHWVIVRFRDKARPHAPLTPGLHGVDLTQKYFCRF